MISSTPQIDEMLCQRAVVAMAVSGGKDSSDMALECCEYLDAIGHAGERILIHSDLGSVEWKDSIVICEKLAEKLNLELVVVTRKAGGMMERWLTRWRNNVQRYIELSCVKLILPWSTPSMRFCTSELKTAVICAELAKRFPGQIILNVVGIRRAESNGRKNALVFKENSRLARADGTRGFDWNAIVENQLEDVFLTHKRFNFPLHEAYTKYSTSRVSCAYCIMGNQGDLKASTECEGNHEIYREMCELEITSAFSFQSNKWLSDVASALLNANMLERLPQAKEIQRNRALLESRIPKHLLYSKNFPEAIPNCDEAYLLSEIRIAVGKLQGFEMRVIKPVEIIARYQELMFEKLHRQKLKKNYEQN